MSPRSDRATMNRKLTLALLAALIAIGFALRVYRLDEYALNPDEAIFVSTARFASLAEVWRASLAHAHPPANFVILHGLLKISDATVWLRAMSLISGTVAIALIYLLGAQLFGRIAGLAAAFLVALSPGLILLSRVCRNYGPGMAFLLASLYFLVRFLREERWRSFYLFAAFEFIAATWHYSFVSVLLSANLLLALGLYARKSPPSAWLRVVLTQIPVAALYLFFYFSHISKMSPELLETAHDVMSLDFTISAASPLYPMIQLSRYLFGPLYGKLFFYLWGISVAMLIARRRFFEIMLCVTPVCLAYGLAMLGRLPLGGSRHGSYLYPFLFLPLGWLISALAEGFRTFRPSAFRGQPRFGPGFLLPSPYPENFQPSGWAFLALAPGIILSFFGTPVVLRDTRFYNVDAKRFQPFGIASPVHELPMRRDELEGMWSQIQWEHGPNDVVLLSHQALLVFREFLLKEPSAFEPGEPLSFTRDGVRFYYSTRGYWKLTPETALEAIGEMTPRYNLKPGDRVWIPSAGWELWNPLLSHQFRSKMPNVKLDQEAMTLSHEALCVIPMGEGTTP